MDSQRNRPPPSTLILRLRDNSHFVELAVLPFLFFVMDMCIRALVGIDVSDAGADMSLVAAAMMLANTFEDFDRGDRSNAVIAVAFFVFSMLCWGGSIWLLSLQEFPTALAIWRNITVLALGTYLFIISSYLAIEFEFVRLAIQGANDRP